MKAYLWKFYRVLSLYYFTHLKNILFFDLSLSLSLLLSLSLKKKMYVYICMHYRLCRLLIALFTWLCINFLFLFSFVGKCLDVSSTEMIFLRATKWTLFNRRIQTSTRFFFCLFIFIHSFIIKTVTIKRTWIKLKHNIQDD